MAFEIDHERIGLCSFPAGREHLAGFIEKYPQQRMWIRRTIGDLGKMALNQCALNRKPPGSIIRTRRICVQSRVIALAKRIQDSGPERRGLPATDHRHRTEVY